MACEPPVGPWAWANFCSRIAELGGVVLEPEWLGSHEPHRCRCAQGHECRPRPKHVRRGIGMCRICAGRGPGSGDIARKAFCRRVTELGGEVLEPEWLGAAKPHRCRCAKGHERRLTPNKVQQGGGICAVCAVIPRSQQAWEAFCRRVTELGGEVLEPEWLGAVKPHRARCAKGHKCRPIPANVHQGKGISLVCVTRDSATAWANFRERVVELGGVVLEPEWLGNRKPHRCRCANGHECSPVPGSVQRGNGICRICAGVDPATAWANFRERVAELGGEVLEPEWLGKDTPHRCRCAKGHECSPRPGNVQGGGGICRACANQDPATAWASFREQVTELGGVVLESEWLGAMKFHRCRCPNGHECSISPNRVQQGGGICQVCARIQAHAQRRATARAEFYERVIAQGGVVLEPEWLGTMKPHRVRCLKGHESSPTPGNIQRGTGICQLCGWMDRDVLYVTRNPVTCCVKFGITSRDGYARLRTHRVDGFTEVLRLITGLPEGLAVLTEQKIKLALAMVDAKPMRGREYFRDEYLALIENEIGNWVPGALAAPDPKPLQSGD